MAVGNMKVRGAADDPDKVLRSGGWALFLAGAAFLVAVGLLFALGGAFAPLDEGEERAWTPVALGVVLAAFGVLLAVVLWGPRPGSALPPATAAPEGGVALPRRRSQQVAAAAGFVVIAGFGVLLAVMGGGPGPLALGVVIALFGAAMFLLLVTGYRSGGGTIVLTPEAVTLPAGTTPATTIAWSDLVEVAAVSGWQPHLVVTFKGPGLATVRLRGQAWTPSVLIRVLERYRTNANARAELTSPSALDHLRR